MLRYLFFNLLLLLCSTTAVAAVFTVTSNADAGPGTLRDAITQAAGNGIFTQDIIQFNLPGNTDRTISLLTQLPELPSNLIIDGTTQPGSPVSANGAKIIIELTTTDASSLLIFSIRQAQNVELYGMVLNGKNLTSAYNYGIYLIASKNITIGAAGKGNVIKNITYGLLSPSFDNIPPALFLSENVRISGNILGLNADGETVDALGGSTISLAFIKDLVFGGLLPADGNALSGRLNINDKYAIPTGDLLISNNLMGTSYNGLAALPNPDNSIFILSIQRNSCIISRNIISHSSLTLAINCFFKIQGNKLGTNLLNTQVFGQPGPALHLANCSNGGLIGGTDPADANIISGGYLGGPNGGANIVNQSSEKVEVVGNIFRCNNSNYAYSATFAPGTHYVTIDERTGSSISGSADPGARVDLYYSSGDCPNCEPEQLFTQIQANAAGKWQYTASLQSKAIIASSTINGSTSEFTRLKFTSTDTDLQITDACNGRNGSIKGITVSETVSYAWYNAANKLISNKKDLENAPPGLYKLVVSNGFCNITTPDYEIKRAINNIPLPSLKNQQICAPGPVTLTVTAPMAGGTYRLYNTVTDDVPIDEQANGVFIAYANTGRSFYVSRAENLCESDRKEVSVTIGISDLKIPNTITPNADGINDLWNINGIENYPMARVDIFNRSGQKIYNANNGYSRPFDGMYNGQSLPTGTYYYVIYLSNQCRMLSGYLTILR